MKKTTAQTTRNQTSNELFGLIVGTYISSTLLLIRMVFSGEMTHLYLFWNLFLAWIPFMLSHLMVKNYNPLRQHPLLLVIVAVTWLLFLPNAPYVITDLKHLQYVPKVPLWFDLVLLSSFAVNGLYLGMYSLSHIQGVIKSLYGPKMTWFVIGMILYLSSLGIYLGRILRWNSWDVVTNPHTLARDVIIRMLNPIEHYRMHLFVFAVAVASYLSYRAFYYSFFERKKSHFH